MKRNILILTALMAALSLPGILHADPPDGPLPWDKDKVLEPGGSVLLIGPYGGIDYNMHTGIFSTSERGLTCCTFDGGNGLGLVVGGKAFIPLADKFNLSPRILYENRAGTFQATPQVYPIRGRANELETITFNNTLNVSLHTLSVDVLATYTLTSFGLYVAAGPTAGFELGNKYTQTETIAAPPGVTYRNGGTSLLVLDSSLTLTKSATVSLRGGIGITFPITPTIQINPEVLYTFPLMNASKNALDGWKISTLQATIGILFTL